MQQFDEGKERNPVQNLWAKEEKRKRIQTTTKRERFLQQINNKRKLLVSGRPRSSVVLQ
jgi:hypothetical protein